MRYLITLMTILGTLFAFLMWGFNTANAGEEYNKAVLGHVIQSKMNGTNVDVNKLMESELQKVAHQFALQSIVILQKYLPTILDGAMAEMRMNADKEYKCALLKGSKIEDKQCQ
jgi:hypothetical protein